MYRLDFPPYLLVVQPIFHDSMLKRYHPDNAYMIQLDSIELDLDLSFEEEPISILDKKTRKLISKSIELMKAQY